MRAFWARGCAVANMSEGRLVSIHSVDCSHSSGVGRQNCAARINRSVGVSSIAASIARRWNAQASSNTASGSAVSVLRCPLVPDVIGIRTEDRTSTKSSSTCAHCSFYRGTPRWTAPSDTWVSNSKMHSPSQKPLKSDMVGRLQRRPTPAVHHRCLCCGAASADRPFAVVAKPRHGQSYAWSFWTFVVGVPKQTVAQGPVSERRNSTLAAIARGHHNMRQRGCIQTV